MLNIYTNHDDFVEFVTILCKAIKRNLQKEEQEENPNAMCIETGEALQTESGLDLEV